MGCFNGGVVKMKSAVIDTCTLINLKNIKRADLLDYLQYNLITTIYITMEVNRGKEETKEFFNYLKSKKKIQQVNLSIEDLVEMASIPKHKKKISDPELSCFIKAKNLGCITFSDDKKAVNYVEKFIQIGKVIGIAEIIRESYLKNFINDSEVCEFITVLKNNKFVLPHNYYYNLAAEKLKKHMLASNNA